MRRGIAACMLVASTLTSCSATHEGERPTTREKQAAYQQEQVKPRIDQIPTESHSPATNTSAGRVVAKTSSLQVGEPVVVNGQVVGTGTSGDAGRVDEIAINAGDYQFALPPESAARNELLPHVGKRVRVSGIITEVSREAVVVNVTGYKLLE